MIMQKYLLILYLVLFSSVPFPRSIFRLEMHKYCHKWQLYVLVDEWLYRSSMIHLWQLMSCWGVNWKPKKDLKEGWEWRWSISARFHTVSRLEGMIISSIPIVHPKLKQYQKSGLLHPEPGVKIMTTASLLSLFRETIRFI